MNTLVFFPLTTFKSLNHDLCRPVLQLAYQGECCGGDLGDINEDGILDVLGECIIHLFFLKKKEYIYRIENASEHTLLYRPLYLY